MTYFGYVIFLLISGVKYGRLMLLESAKSWLVLGRVAVDAWVNDCHEREGGGDGKDGLEIVARNLA